MKLGELILEYRVKNSISQRQFAKLVGMSNTHIANVEAVYKDNGTVFAPSGLLIKKCATIFGLSEFELLQKLDEDQLINVIVLKVSDYKIMGLNNDERFLLEKFQSLPLSAQKELFSYIDYLFTKNEFLPPPPRKKCKVKLYHLLRGSRRTYSYPNYSFNSLFR